MTGRQKILTVLKDIKRESEINADPTWIKFEFNTRVVGAGILGDDQEKRILMKLKNEAVIEIHMPDGEIPEDQAVLSAYTPEEFMMEHDFIYIKILPTFYRKLFWYNLTSFNENSWNIINPFWIIWQIFTAVFFAIEWLWEKS